MNPLIEKLTSNGITVTDGSWGTQMQARGLTRGESPDSWNLTHPEQVEEVARQYVDAGSQIILTNTFSANRFVLEKFKMTGDAEKINQAGVTLSKNAAGDRALVFASIGPSGRMLITGEVTEDDLFDAFVSQAAVLSQAGADGLVIETMTDMVEAGIAVRAAKQTGLPVVACMVFDSGKNKDRTMMGNTVEDAVKALSSAGADVVGANCGQGIEGFVPICKQLHEATDLPIWIKANAGLPEVIKGETVYQSTIDDFLQYVPDLISNGAVFIGGCCGTNDGFIRALRQMISQM